MANTSPLQKTGLQMLLGRERFEALMAEAERTGLSMATVVRTGIDNWLSIPPDERPYPGAPATIYRLADHELTLRP